MGCFSAFLTVVGFFGFALIPKVGFVLAILWVGLCFWMSRIWKSIDTPGKPATLADSHEARSRVSWEAPAVPSTVRTPAKSNKKSGHTPPPPSGVAVEPWSPKTRQFEVAGEYYRTESIVELFRGIGISGPDGAETRLDATLVPDPANPFDRNAVAVYVGGLHVGYMERGDAKSYHRAIADMLLNGEAATVRSRQWVRKRGADIFARVTLSLPEPEGFAAVNVLDVEGPVVLPVGPAIQVTKEDQYMESLRPFLRGDGGETPLAVSLHAIVDIRPRSAVEVVEVRVEDGPVGLLTTLQSTNILPLVKFLEARQLTAVARATLRGNSLKADIALHVAKSQDVDPAWLEALGPELPHESQASRPAFEWGDGPGK